MPLETMPATPGQSPVFRFAPSPNGLLHLGHAYSAILNHRMAKEKDGRLLLRIEDIDLARCTADFELAIYRDLEWLGLRWEEPVRRQSEHFAEYAAALDRLIEMGLAYPAFMTRGAVRARVAAQEAAGKTWLRDPDGSPVYPGDDRERSAAEQHRMLSSGMRHAWRLDMRKAMGVAGGGLAWEESGEGSPTTVEASPEAWGDVVLSRSDAPSSYHLSVVVDDALQGVTHVVRGRDLFHATSVHRLLQTLLDLPQPLYHHHRLVLGEDGRKLSKSERSTGLAALRDAGVSVQDVRRRIGL